MYHRLVANMLHQPFDITHGNVAFVFVILSVNALNIGEGNLLFKLLVDLLKYVKGV